MGDLFCRHNQFALNFTREHPHWWLHLCLWGKTWQVWRQFCCFYLNDLIAGFDLSDIWRRQQYDEQNFAWTGKNEWQFLYADSHWSLPKKQILYLNPYISAAHISPYATSLYEYLPLTLDFDQVLQGAGFRHFNNNLLLTVSFTMRELYFGGMAGKDGSISKLTGLVGKC